MNQYYSQKLEMQIQKENTYTESRITAHEKRKLTDFLKKHFKFPSNESNKIEEFISEDPELEKIICELPKIITAELEYNQLSLDFMKESDSDEKILEIIIHSNSDEKILLQKEDIISDGIIDKYPDTKNEYIILVEPYVG